MPRGCRHIPPRGSWRELTGAGRGAVGDKGMSAPAKKLGAKGGVGKRGPAGKKAPAGAKKGKGAAAQGASMERHSHEL